MTVSTKGRAFLAALEGSESQAYRDVAGHWTIGVGHRITQSELTSGKIYVSGEPVRWRFGLSARVMDELLAQDLKTAEATVALYTTVKLEQHEFDALTSFAFNVGVSAFRRSTLLKKLNRGDRESVPSELARWYYAGGQAVNGLRIRRKREGLLFERGDYGGVVVEPSMDDEKPSMVADVEPMPTRPPSPLPVSLPETHRQALARATPAQKSAYRELERRLRAEITKPHSTLWDMAKESDEFETAMEGGKVFLGAALSIGFELFLGVLIRASGLETDDGGVG